jgi:hypothetical protein
MKKIIITTGIVAVAGGVTTALLMSSCDPCEWEEQPSVIVHIVDQDAETGNRFVSADAVRYTFTDQYGNKVSMDGECFGDGNDGDCSKWKLGNGEPGTYEFYATVCGREFGSKVMVEPNEGTCELETVVAELPVDLAGCEPDGGGGGTELAPELPLNDKAFVCDKWAQLSVIARLEAKIGSALVPIGADKAYYTWDGAPDERERDARCLREDCGVFSAGVEQTGHFTITAEACGEVASAEVAVKKTEDSCHVDTQEVMLIIDGSKCDELDKINPNEMPPKCEPKLVPSALIFPIKQSGDLWMPQGTQDLVFEHDGTRHHGYCAKQGPNNQCTLWVAGWGRTGRFQAYTEKCGVETAFEFTVEATEDGCYPRTRYLPVEVDTHGCIRPSGPEGGDHGPDTPAAGDDVRPPDVDPVDPTDPHEP